MKVDIILEQDASRTVEVIEKGGHYLVSIVRAEGEAAQEFAVDFDNSSGAAQLRIGDRSYLVEVSERGGRYAVCVQEHCLEARLLTAEQRLREQLDGSLGSSKNSVEAKMPGKVLDVFVKAGAKVEEGDKLAILEAMKMENTIRAPRAGTIATIGVTKGDNVQAGHALVVLEEE